MTTLAFCFLGAIVMIAMSIRGRSKYPDDPVFFWSFVVASGFLALLIGATAGTIHKDGLP